LGNAPDEKAKEEMSKLIRQRCFCVCLLALALGAVLAGCGGAANPAEAPTRGIGTSPTGPTR
jgi:ABC-type glycerol-3-phosphate transport system substrate-binding protein